MLHVRREYISPGGRRALQRRHHLPLYFDGFVVVDTQGCVVCEVTACATVEPFLECSEHGGGHNVHARLQRGALGVRDACATRLREAAPCLALRLGEQRLERCQRAAQERRCPLHGVAIYSRVGSLALRDSLHCET